MQNATGAQRNIGQVVTLQDGRLGITVYPLDEGHILMLVRGELARIACDKVAERPARCVLCRASAWWWQAGVDQPRCGRCERPNAEWYEATWQAAYHFLAHAASGPEFAPVQRALDRLTLRGRAAPVLQQVAFADRGAALVVQWHEQAGLWE